MNDLETRLRDLGRSHDPATPPLSFDELHARARRVERTRLLVTAGPAVVAVLALLAGAVVLLGRQPAEVVAGGPGTTLAPNDALPPRERELVDVVRALSALRYELHREAILSASYASTNKARSKPELAEQRLRTDAALRAYGQTIARVDPGREGWQVVERLTQADIRINSLVTIRRSVDAIQTDPMKLVEQYRSTTTDLRLVEHALTNVTDHPSYFRGLLSHLQLATLADSEADVASLLTISVEIGFYAKKLPHGGDPVPERNDELGGGCANDASGAGAACPIYRAIIQANAAVALAEDQFDQWATSEQKQRKRLADAGSEYDERKRYAIEDGIGHNDLRGLDPGTVGVGSPDDWLRDALDRVDRLAAVEDDLADLIGTPRPPPPTTRLDPTTTRPR